MPPSPTHVPGVLLVVSITHNPKSKPRTKQSNCPDPVRTGRGSELSKPPWLTQPAQVPELERRCRRLAALLRTKMSCCVALVATARTSDEASFRSR